jgi:hypothetical protein
MLGERYDERRNSAPSSVIEPARLAVGADGDNLSREVGSVAFVKQRGEVRPAARDQNDDPQHALNASGWR